MRLRLAPYLRKPPPIFASGKHFVQLYHWQTSHTQERYRKQQFLFTLMLLKGKYKPLTDSIFFLKAEIDTFNESFQKWHKSIDIKYSEEKITGKFSDIISCLLPITVPIITKYLIIPTKSEWLAFFDNGILGTDGSAPSYISEEIIRCQMIRSNCSDKGVVLEYRDPRQSKYKDEYGIEHYQNDRYIYYSGLEAKGYKFKTSGQPFPFEDLERYKIKPLKKRFDCELLKKYLLEFNIDAFNPDFYLPKDKKGILLTKKGLHLKTKKLNLKEAQSYYDKP